MTTAILKQYKSAYKDVSEAWLMWQTSRTHFGIKCLYRKSVIVS